MTPAQAYRINSPNTVHEIIDGEAIIINMKLGYYYSTDSTGAFIWELISQNMNLEGILSQVMLRYSGERADIPRSVQAFIDRLLAENLITASPDGKDVYHPPTNDAFSGEVIPFSPPELLKYTDLQDLLLLDPIHEVDESGWPRPAAEGTESGSR